MELTVFPIPIRDSVIVKVQLPPDLTKLEAEKIARVVMAFVAPTPVIAENDGEE